MRLVQDRNGGGHRSEIRFVLQRSGPGWGPRVVEKFVEVAVACASMGQWWQWWFPTIVDPKFIQIKKPEAFDGTPFPHISSRGQLC